MDRIEVFQILGIEDTKDVQAIKNAYRAKLATTNPEDDPEGFKRLRAAYEEADRLAKQPDNQESEETLHDTSPSGLWVEKAAEIYGNINFRQDISRWEALFKEDCFLSLEEEENCRLKLLRFLMEHFRLPSDVWKLLDKRLNIVGRADALRENFPADFIRYVVNKCERGEDVDFAQFQGPEDGDYDLFFQHYDRCFQAFQEGDLEKARENIQNADALGIYHPVLEICRAELFVRQEKTAEALELLESLYARYPKDVMICYNTAENMWKQGEKDPALKDKAAEIYRKLKADNDNHYMANLRLAEWYCDNGQHREAKKCAEKVLTARSDPAFMELLVRINKEIERELEAEYCESGSWEPALELCWCYLQDGKISKGIRMALSLERQIPPEKQAEYNGLLAKLYVEEAEYEASIAMTRHWEAELERKLAAGEEEEDAEKDRDRIKQAHLIRMQCHHNMGFCTDSRNRFNDAILEGESVLEDNIKDAGILLELAQIRMERMEFDLCMELVDKLLVNYQVFAAHATAMEAYSRQRDAAGVVNHGRRCIQYFPDFVKPYEYLAKVYLDLNRPEDFQKVMEDARKNNITSVILEAYEYQMNHRGESAMTTKELDDRLNDFRKKYLAQVEKGKLEYYMSGLPVLTELLYRFPESYLLVERGVFHKAAHHYEEAKADYEKALSLSPANPYAFNGLSQVYKYLGDYDKALVCIKKAILYIDKEMTPVIYTDMADIYSLLGDYERALEAYRQYEAKAAPNTQGTWFQNRLAECYRNLGQAQEACSVYQRYQARLPYESLREQADTYGRLGDREQAIQVLGRWKAQLDGKYGSKFMRGLSMRGHRLGLYSKTNLGCDYCRYHNMTGWVELMTGTAQGSLFHFRESLKYIDMVQREKSPVGLVSDAVFAFAVMGEEKLGIRWAKTLKKLLETEKVNVERYYKQEKNLLMYELLVTLFLESNAKVRELLDREDNFNICWFCTSPVCREVEGVHILFLLKEGRREEAKERLMNNLKLQPVNEYMLAIRHFCFGDKL